MKNVICFICAFLIVSFCNAQIKLNPTIYTGVTFRFPPWFIESKSVTVNPYDFSYSYHDRKVRLALDIRQSLSNNQRLRTQFSNNLTFTEFRKVRNDVNNPNSYSSDKTLKRDHFLDILYTILPIKNNGGLTFGAGLGYMNCGTKFYYEDKFDQNLNPYPIPQIRKGTMRYISPRFLIAFEKKPFNLNVIFYSPPDEEGEKRATIMMDVKLVYGFKLFKKDKAIRVFDK
jgi:hypothetical protein